MFFKYILNIVGSGRVKWSYESDNPRSTLLIVKRILTIQLNPLIPKY